MSSKIQIRWTEERFANVDWSYLVVVIPEPDADGAAGSGQDGCHGVEMDQHICNLLQDQLLIHNCLETSQNGR